MLKLQIIPLDYYIFSALLNFLVTFSYSLFIFLKNPRSSLNRTFAAFCLSTAQWSLFYFLWLSTRDIRLADFYIKTCMIGVIFLPSSFTHFVIVFIGLKKNKLFILLNYLISLFLVIVLYSSLFAKPGNPFLVFPYWPLPGTLFPVHLAHFFVNLIYSYFMIFKALKHSKGVFREQIRYVLLGTGIGFLGGLTNYFCWYRINIPPFSNISASLAAPIITYAILKYRLMDIKVAVTRAGIFALVYAIVLGLPFWVGYITKLWFFSTALGILLASTGPFIYHKLRRRAEDLLLKDQRRYQRALLDLSKTMTRIRDLDQLLRAIVLTVVDKVKVSFAAIYIKDEEYKSYRLKHCYPKLEASRFPELIPFESNIAKLLYKEKRPLIQEETVGSFSPALDSGLIIPCIIEEDFLGFMFLGSKPNNQMYTPDDRIVFETLSYSTSLAIENCRFWKEIEDRQRKARLQEMDTYSYSLAHEIDNPMYIIIGQAQILQKALLKELNLPEDKQKDLESSLNFILESAWRVSGMVKAIRDFGSPATGEFKPLKVEDVVESFAKLYFPQFKNAGVTFAKELPAQTFYIRGEKPELMQVLVILANNSLHAMKYSQTKQITLSVEPSNQDAVKILFKDTGSGIKKDLLPVIFAPFTTTKASSEGTGMGLYNAQKIIIRHKGKIWAESEGENKGTTFFIELPVAAGITPEEFKNEDKGRRLF